MTLRSDVEQALRENKDIDHGASSGPCVRIGADRMQALLDGFDRITTWLDSQASRDEARAKDGRFPGLQAACIADAKNYRAMAKYLRSLIGEVG